MSPVEQDSSHFIRRGEHSLETNHKDRIFSQIKADIIRCILKPGQAVSEAKLAARYSVGKAPVRDALARLGHEGFVISQARKGHLIAPITIRDVIDLYGVRMALEPAAARLAAGQVDADLLKKCAKACEQPVYDNDPDSIANFLRANTEFHRAIAIASGNRRLAKQISDLLDDTERVRHVMVGASSPRSEAIVEHDALVEALVEGDKDEAERLAKAHVQRGWRMVLSSLLSRFRFMDLNIGGPLEESIGDHYLDGLLAAGTDDGKGARIVDFVNTLGQEKLENPPLPQAISTIKKVE
jgi:DNA-binding GntR family transcriptional regulator